MTVKGKYGYSVEQRSGDALDPKTGFIAKVGVLCYTCFYHIFKEVRRDALSALQTRRRCQKWESQGTPTL